MTVKFTVLDATGKSWTLDVTPPLTFSLTDVPAPAPAPVPQPATPTRLAALGGWDSEIKDLDASKSALGTPSYMRDFGVASDGRQGWDLSAPNSRRSLFAEANGVELHYSHKGITELARIQAWANSTTLDSNIPFQYTPHHEPMGDLTPEVYVAQAAAAVNAVKQGLGKAGAGLMRYNGPILTRYWMAHNPMTEWAKWWYKGATAFYADSYMGKYYPTGLNPYPGPEYMFGDIAKFARTLGVPWGVPELGGERAATDTSGRLRAAWITTLGAWLLEQPDFIGFGWWNIGGCTIAAGSPEAVALKAVIRNFTDAAD